MRKPVTFESEEAVRAAIAAIEVSIEFLQDTMLDDIAMTPVQVRILATQHEAYIRNHITEAINMLKSRMAELDRLKSALLSLKSAI